MKRVVCVGGGTGEAQLLRGLSRARLRLTGVVGVTDNGGHSGLLRRNLGIPAVGDMRSCLAALAPEAGSWAGLLGHRFRGGVMEGVSLGNMVLAGLLQREGSFSAAVRRISSDLGIETELLPVSDDDAHVCARLEGGREVRGEWEIILRQPPRPVERLFHRPRLRALPQVLDRIRKADLVVFAPGCLLTGILATVLAEGLPETLARSKALKVQVVNLMTQPGQTDGMDARAHLETFERLSGVRPDVVILNTARPARGLLKRYGEEGARPVEDDLPTWLGVRVIRGDLMERVSERRLDSYGRGGGSWHARPHFIRHDSARLARMVEGLL